MQFSEQEQSNYEDYNGDEDENNYNHMQISEQEESNYEDYNGVDHENNYHENCEDVECEEPGGADSDDNNYADDWDCGDNDNYEDDEL